MSVRAIWILAAACAALALAWLALRTPPPPPQAEPRPPARVSPLAAAASAPDPAAALAELATTTMWGPRAARADAAALAASAAAEPAWFLAGVYGPPGQRVVVVRFDGQAQPAQQLRVGQRLPDGARIDAIEIDRVRVQSTVAPARGRLRSLWLPVNRGLPLPDNWAQPR